MTIESMGVSEQVVVLGQLADTLKDVVASNSPMDRDTALEKAADEAKVPYSQMKHVLTYALNEGLVRQDRVRAILSV